MQHSKGDGDRVMMRWLKLQAELQDMMDKMKLQTKEYIQISSL